MTLKSFNCVSGIVGGTTASVIITSPSSETTTPGPTYSNLPYSYSQVSWTATREGVMSVRSFWTVSEGTSARSGRHMNVTRRSVGKMNRVIGSPVTAMTNDETRMTNKCRM